MPLPLLHFSHRRPPHCRHIGKYRPYLSVDEEEAAAEVVHVGEHRPLPVRGWLLLRQAQVPDFVVGGRGGEAR